MKLYTEGPRTGQFLISEAGNDGHRSRDSITLAAGQVYNAGHVLGKVVLGAASVSATGGNTGNATFGAIAVGAAAHAGAYILRITKAAAGAGDYEVIDPAGEVAGLGSLNAAYNVDGLSFTLTHGATDVVVGDSWSITVAAGNGQYREWNPANTDGSQRACAILWAAQDATTVPVSAAAITRDAEVRGSDLTFFSGAQAADQANAAGQLSFAHVIVR